MRKSYRDLDVWREAKALVLDTYRATVRFPPSEQFGLTNQMRRAAVSIPSNIAEGYGRFTPGERKQFLGHARGSINELETQVEIARDLGFLESERATAMLAKLDRLGRSINGLIRFISRDRPPGTGAR